jgi:Cu/Ag efflux protein CusF
MNRWLSFTAAAVTTTTLLSAGLALGQQKPAECNTKAPAKVEGQVLSVDQAAGKMTIRDKSGATHEFQASKETLAEMKAGDTIEATLRKAPNC